jgi:protein SCO1
MLNRRELFASFASPVRRSPSLGPEYYTNAVLLTHEGKQVRFYDDLVKDKLVVFNFMYANCTGSCPMTTANLVRVQKLLGDRVGRDVFMYSITLKPQEDGPDELMHYAMMHKVQPGWTFLTGDPYDIDTIRFRLFRWEHPGLDLDLTQHTGMVRTINDRMDRWSMCPTLARPEQIVEAIHWVEETKPFSEIFQANLEAQARIDREARGAHTAAAGGQ